MKRSKALIGAIALSTLAAACSGGGSAPAEPEATDEPTAAAPAEEPATPPPAEDAGPPAADDVATLDGTEYANFTGDAAAGKAVFAQCRTCHTTEEGKNMTGPSLHNVVGREAGTVAGFNYSDANKNSGITWTEQKLFQYLEKPQRVIPGTKMIFPGLPDAQKRADVIAYLKNPT